LQLDTSEKPSVPKLLLTVADVSKMLSVGQTKVAELIAAKSLPTVRIGRSVRISSASLQKRIEEHEDQGVSA
jgi:excisionase family DNA binding protein